MNSTKSTNGDIVVRAVLIFIFRVKRFCDYSAVVNFFFSPRGEKRGSISADNLAMFVARRWKRLVDGRKKAGVEK